MVFRVLEVFQKFRVFQPYGGGLLALTLQMLVLKPKPTPLNPKPLIPKPLTRSPPAPNLKPNTLKAETLHLRPKPRAPSLNLLMTWLVRSISVGLIDPVPS